MVGFAEIRNVRDAGLFLRQLQTAFSQEFRDQRFDFIFQQFLRFAGDDKVVGVADKMDPRFPSLGAAFPSDGIFEVLPIVKTGFRSV